MSDSLRAILVVPLALFLMWLIWAVEDGYFQRRHEDKFRKDMERYLNSGYGYDDKVHNIYDQIIRQEKVVNNGHKIYDEIVRQERIKGEINAAKTKKQ